MDKLKDYCKPCKVYLVSEFCELKSMNGSQITQPELHGDLILYWQARSLDMPVQEYMEQTIRKGYCVTVICPYPDVKFDIANDGELKTFEDYLSMIYK